MQFVWGEHTQDSLKGNLWIFLTFNEGEGRIQKPDQKYLRTKLHGSEKKYNFNDFLLKGSWKKSHDLKLYLNHFFFVATFCININWIISLYFVPPESQLKTPVNSRRRKTTNDQGSSSRCLVLPTTVVSQVHWENSNRRFGLFENDGEVWG